MSKQRILACPLCGETQYEQSVCKQCGGSLDPEGLLLAEASFGPWYIRDEDNPFAPGMTYDILAQKVADEAVHRFTLVRGPTTRQLWIVAKRVPGIAHLLGRCHKCDEHVDTEARTCPACNVAFGGYRERDSLGLDTNTPKQVEAQGVSSFLGDTVIFNTTSEPLKLTRPIAESTDEPESEDGPGTPAFRSMQRQVEALRRKNRILVVAMSVLSLSIMILLISTFKNTAG